MTTHPGHQGPGIPQGNFTIPDFLQWARISRSKAYEEIAAGRLRIVKCGRRTLVPVEEATRWRDALRRDAQLPTPGRPKAGPRAGRNDLTHI